MNGRASGASGADHWDAFWRARDPDVSQADAGANDPALGEFWLELFERELVGSKILRVLDVACGNGAVTRLALQASAASGTDIEACCIDYSQMAIDELRAECPLVTGVACDLRHIPFDEHTFDLVVSQFGIEYGGIEAFDEAARLVAANGVLAAIVHMCGGAIQRECAGNLEVVTALNESELMPRARDAFAAGFDLVAGRISESRFRQTDRPFATAVATVKGILDAHGPRAIGGLLANVFKDIGYMYARIPNYVPEEVFAWIDDVSAKFTSFEGRMDSMANSALDRAAIDDVGERLAAQGFAVTPTEALAFRKTGDPAAWILVARRGG